VLHETMMQYLSAFNISFTSLSFKRKETALPEPVLPDLLQLFNFK